MGTRGKLLALGALLIVVIVIHVPSIRFGWFGDDYAHRRFILDQLAGESDAAWWNMFDTRVGGDPSGPDPDTLLGRMPWWASPDFQFSLFRPLGAASHFADYLLWPDAPWAMHVHNLVLFGMIVVVSSSLYQQLIGSGWQAALATALLAIDDANTATAAWIASRNTLLTLLFALVTLALHARSARLPRSASWAAALTLLMAHASSEGAVVAWGLLIAHAACLDRRPIAVRFGSLAPLAAVSIAWLALSSALGYGVRGSTVYVDPRVEPIAFAADLLPRLLPLLEAQLAMQPSYLGANLLGVWAVRAYLVLFVCAALWAARRSRVVGFFAIATLLCLVPQCATDRLGRLLMLSSFAAHGLTASVLGAVAAACTVRARPVILAPLGLALAFMHGWVALELPQYVLRYAGLLHESVLRAAQSLPSGVEQRGATTMVLNYPDYLSGVFVATYRDVLFGPGPERMHMLSFTATPLRLTRTSPDTIRLESRSLLDATTSFVRKVERRFLPGERFELGEAQVEVAAVDGEGAPTAVLVRTSQGNSRPLAWVSYSPVRRRFERVNLPDPGQSIVIGSAR